MASQMQRIIDSNQPRVGAYVRDLLEKVRQEHGPDSSQYKGLHNQYFIVPSKEPAAASNARHFYAQTDLAASGGMERMYRRTVVVDLVSACASECAYCVRGYYDAFSLSEARMDAIASQVAIDPFIREVLITGGDPLMAQKKLMYLIDKIRLTAKNVKFVRIGTRVPVQNPALIKDDLIRFFEGVREDLQVELACQINHSVELQLPTRTVLRQLQNAGVLVYSQNVLLKRVNDSAETLLELYDELRYLNIPPHYLFHAVPLRGTDKFRTSVARGLDLISTLTTSGLLSGRAKPQYAIISDVGKINLYHGSIVDKEGDYLILKTKYSLSERLKWNPSYRLPQCAEVRDDGFLYTKYLDGNDQ